MNSQIPIVFAAANPRGTTHLQLDEEVRRIDTQLAQARQLLLREGGGGRVGTPMLHPVWAASFTDLLRSLSAVQPAVLHFSGHGHGEAGLVMNADGGGSALVEGPQLRQVLGEFGKTLRLVVLNACYAEVQAEAIRQVIDCVIGMRDEVSDRGALIFSSTLYGQLALGCSVGRAFRLAQAAVAVESRRDADIPVLLAKPGSEPDQIFVTLPPPPASDPSRPEWQHLLDGDSPGRPALRKAINLLLETDAELDAFVGDRRNDTRYARVYREWGSNMQRTAKINLLFTYGPSPVEIKRDLLDFAG